MGKPNSPWYWHVQKHPRHRVSCFKSDSVEVFLANTKGSKRQIRRYQYLMIYTFLLAVLYAFLLCAHLDALASSVMDSGIAQNLALFDAGASNVRALMYDYSDWEPAESSLLHKQDTSRLTLRPGDLPGYTGWARPSVTLADYFEIDPSPTPLHRAVVGSTWHMQLRCPHHYKACRENGGGAMFDVRAYGPAVLPGYVHDHGFGMYEVALRFFDAGLYTVEVILAYSKPPPFDTFPVQEEPVYEGYLLPGFPFQVQVDHPKEDNPNGELFPFSLSFGEGHPRDIAGENVTRTNRACKYRDLVDKTPLSGFNRGRWIIAKRHAKIRSDSNHLTNSELEDEWDRSSPDPISLEGYQSGANSLGIQMEDVNVNCTLQPMDELKEAMRGRKKHIVFIGDSNMRLQYQILQKQGFHNVIETTYIPANDGLALRMGEIRQEFLKLQESISPKRDVFVVFNSGLHDIAQLCSQRWSKRRKKYVPNGDETFSCTGTYSQYLGDLVQLIQRLPAKMYLFQSTSAGWPKWGNFGFSWPPNKGQTLPLDPHFCSYINQIAWRIMNNANIPVLDTFWMTLARPDHREIGHDNEIGKHLVHAGPEVYDTLIRETLTLIDERSTKKTIPSAGAR